MVNFCASVSRKCSKKIITISWNYDCRVIDISLPFLQTLVITYIINYQKFPTVIYGWHLNFGYQISKIKSITCTIWTKFCYISSVCPLILANLSKLAASIVTKWSSFVPILIFLKNHLQLNSISVTSNIDIDTVSFFWFQLNNQDKISTLWAAQETREEEDRQPGYVTSIK